MVIEINTDKRYIGVSACEDLSELGRYLVALAPMARGYTLHIDSHDPSMDDFFGVTNNTMEVKDEEIENS